MCWTLCVCLNTVASTLHAFSLLSSVREVLLLQSRKLRPGDAESLAVDIQLVSGRVGIGSRGDSEPTVLTTWLSYCHSLSQRALERLHHLPKSVVPQISVSVAGGSRITRDLDSLCLQWPPESALKIVLVKGRVERIFTPSCT